MIYVFGFFQDLKEIQVKKNFRGKGLGPSRNEECSRHKFTCRKCYIHNYCPPDFCNSHCPMEGRNPNSEEQTEKSMFESTNRIWQSSGESPRYTATLLGPQLCKSLTDALLLHLLLAILPSVLHVKEASGPSHLLQRPRSTVLQISYKTCFSFQKAH